MYDLVAVKRNEVFTTSRIIAEGTGNQHHAIRELIKKYHVEIEEFGSLVISNEESSGGRPIESFLLNEEQATFVITLMRNSKMVVTFKKELVKQFYAMRRFIIEKQSEEWNAARSTGKEIRLKETDVIKLLVDYAKDQGSEHSEELYRVYAKLVKRTLPGKRDEMTITELNNITLLENVILQTIRIDMSMGMNYKDIYADCRERVEKLAELAYLKTGDKK